MIQQFDYFYRSTFLRKFINNLTKGGCYFLVEKIVYKIFKKVNLLKILYYNYKLKTKFLPVLLFFEVIFICRPLLQARIRKVRKRGKKKLGKKGKALNTKVIPTNISRDNSYNLTVRCFALAIKNKKERTLEKAIIKEFQEILINSRGETLERKRKLYNLIVVNRSFAHFRW
jgi:ribosomal protein S7